MAEDRTPTQNQAILALLREQGPMSMSKVAIALGKNPGGVRNRLLLLQATGNVVKKKGPLGALWAVPDEKEGQP